MPSTLSITISNNDPHPNGSSATMSRSNANGNPNQATWTASDRQYSISLPANVWNAPPGQSLSFSVAQGATSAIYTLKSNAPTGDQSYSIATPSGDIPPKVVVEP